MKIVMRICCLLLPALLGACATGRTAFDKGKELERSGRYDEAVLKYSEAVASDPDSGEYRLSFLKSSEEAGKVHLKAGDEAFAAKRLDEAFSEYQRAMVLDPSQDRARQQLEVVKKLRLAQHYFAEGEAFEKENKLREAVRSYQKSLNLDGENKDAADALERLLKTRKSKTDGYELNLKSSKPITLKFKDAKLKDVFKIISQLSGINFVFDEAVKDVAVTIYLENASFYQALDIICGMHKLGRKILNESTIIVYTRTPDKTKQYEELYVQTFFLNKLDAKKAVNLVRTMLQVKKIYVNEEMNTLVIRDTLDVIEVARRILEANDVPDAEVVLEVEVIELSKKNAESFGLALSKYATSLNLMGPSGQFFVDTFATATTTSGTTDTTTVTQANTSQLLNLFRWGDYRGYVTVPSATFNFGKTLGNAETLSNPKIRVKNREKAKFNVGTRVPITTTSSNGVGNYNVNVQYVDVGVKINAEPTIQLNNEVNIKLGLEVSSILSKEKVGTDQNTQVVTIGTRNMDTVLSLKDGETSVIGGLIQDTKGHNSNKVFLLGDIPVLGPLFSSHDNTGDKTELILAISPHIVRGVTVSDPEVTSFWSGLEDDPSIAKGYSSFEQQAEYALPAPATPPAASQPQGQKSAPAASPQPPPTRSQPVQQPQSPSPVPASPPQAAAVAAPPAALPVQPTPPVEAAPQPAAAPIQSSPPAVIPPPPTASQPPLAPVAAVPSPQAPPEKKVSLRFAAPLLAKQGEQFSAEVLATDANKLVSAPLIIVFDPGKIEAVEVVEGDLFKQHGGGEKFSSKIDNQGGRIEVKLEIDPKSGGITGAGNLVTIKFRGMSPGSAGYGFLSAKLQAAGGKAVETILYNGIVEVQKP